MTVFSLLLLRHTNLIGATGLHVFTGCSLFLPWSYRNSPIWPPDLQALFFPSSTEPHRQPARQRSPVTQPGGSPSEWQPGYAWWPHQQLRAGVAEGGALCPGGEEPDEGQWWLHSWLCVEGLSVFGRRRTRWSWVITSLMALCGLLGFWDREPDGSQWQPYEQELQSGSFYVIRKKSSKILPLTFGMWMHSYCHAHIHTHIYMYTHTRIYTCTHTHTHIYMYTHTHAYIHVHTHTHIYMYTHTHAYTHTH